MEDIIDVREPALTTQEAALLSTALNSTTMSCRAARLLAAQDDRHFIPVASQNAGCTCSRNGDCACRGSRAGRAVLRARGICMPSNQGSAVSTTRCRTCSRCRRRG